MTRKNALLMGLSATFALPFVNDIEDFIWEAIFAYMKDIPIVDPLTNIRSKRLFDVVDERRKIGWSIKSVQRIINLPCEFEVVIQRADIFKKAKQLGFEELTLDSPTERLGAALLKHWYEEKVRKDTQFQGVEDERVSILLKSPNRKEYAYFEERLAEYRHDELRWEWTNETKTGLQAKRDRDDILVFRWYPNQKQFFERFALPESVYTFSIEPKRLSTGDVVSLLLAELQGKP
jgi:hypothetical protein